MRLRLSRDTFADFLRESFPILGEIVGRVDTRPCFRVNWLYQINHDGWIGKRSLGPLPEGAVAKRLGECSFNQSDTPSDLAPLGHLKVNCPKGKRGHPGVPP